MRVTFKVGTEGSGHHGHRGRVGEVGGSMPRGGAPVGDPEYEARRARAREALRAYRARRFHPETLAAPVAAAPPPVTTEEAAAAMRQRYNVFEMIARIPANISDDQVSINLPPDVWNKIREAFPMMDENMLKHIMYVEGLRVEVGYEYGDVSAKMYDQDGDLVGRQQIGMDSRYNIHMSYLKFEHDAMGKSLGMPLVIKQLAYFKMLGAQSANMNADISIGKYSWAKPGVEYGYGLGQVRSVREKYVAWMSTMSMRSSRYGFSQATVNAMRADNRWESFTHPWEWAQYSIPGATFPENMIYNDERLTPGNYNVGKAFMLDDNGHGSWDAVVDLTKITL